MKKLLALIVIGGLFSLGCTDTGTKTEPKKDKMPSSKMKVMGGEGKEESKAPDAGKAKDEGDKKETKKDDAASKKDDAAPKKDDAAPKKDADKKDKDKK